MEFKSIENMPNTVCGQRKQHCMSLSTVHVYLSALREICVEKLVLFISSGDTSVQGMLVAN